MLYTFSIYFYLAIIRVAALFDDKARLWLAGRKDFFPRLKSELETKNQKENPVIWVHCSSLGEFEQGRPVIEKIKTSFPQYRILLTFFSPSGYEIRKNYEQANWVFYLPLDTTRNAREFVKAVKPVMVFFIKYDYWFNFLNELKSKHIPVLLVSAVFRPSQYFFRWYGFWFRKQLEAITWFFVQNEFSLSMLKTIGKHNASLTGDTRFDRVAEIASREIEFPLIRQFCGNSRVLIAGSTWKEDENILVPFIQGDIMKMKFIIAPHDTSPGRVQELCNRIRKSYLKYSELTPETINSADILIIDTIGILAHLYRYATIAYIGGGFGMSIHNIQEPITFGVPVFFGPNYHKFKEAVDLISQGAAYTVRTTAEMIQPVSKLISDPEYYSKVSAICRRYIDQNKGATEKILREIIGLGLFPASKEQGSQTDSCQSENLS